MGSRPIAVSHLARKLADMRRSCFLDRGDVNRFIAAPIA